MRIDLRIELHNDVGCVRSNAPITIRCKEVVDSRTLAEELWIRNDDIGSRDRLEIVGVNGKESGVQSLNEEVLETSLVQRQLARIKAVDPCLGAITDLDVASKRCETCCTYCADILGTDDSDSHFMPPFVGGHHGA
ncbi:MAG: hypothetical protein O3B42_06975 [Actinomycetota bacterium]|nr:hypothetical protein [Actinomycetota bacterium]